MKLLLKKKKNVVSGPSYDGKLGYPPFTVDRCDTAHPVYNI